MYANEFALIFSESWLFLVFLRILRTPQLLFNLLRFIPRPLKSFGLGLEFKQTFCIERTVCVVPGCVAFGK